MTIRPIRWILVLPVMAIAWAAGPGHALAAPSSLKPPSWIAESDQAAALFGASVASAGDVNGDGYADVIVGASGYDGGQDLEGRAFVYYGSAAGLSLTPNWTAEPDQATAQFGVSVAVAGDVNGDGYGDVIVGAPGYDGGQMNEGRAFAYYGSAAGLSTTPDWTAEADQEGAGFGISVAGAGDVDGDGYDDVIVGASGYDSDQPSEGRAFAYYGSASGLSTTPNWTAESDSIQSSFAYSVAGAGDVNGDGFDDAIIGAPGYDGGHTREGRAFIYHGSGSGLATIADWTAESDQAGADFGISVDGAGDVNGDGLADVLVGAYFYDNGQINEGRAFAYHGSAEGAGETPAWKVESDRTYATLGRAVAGAGDVNRDGYDDVILGAPEYDHDRPSVGGALIYAGSPTGLRTVSSRSGRSDQAFAYFGYAVAGAGDVNGDGLAEVLVGAYFYDNDQTDEGRVFGWYGRPI
jgi:hypothetical protein